MVQQDLLCIASSRQPLAPRALGEAVARRVASSPHASEGVCGSPVIGALSLSFELGMIGYVVSRLHPAQDKPMT
jgi:hypothetical protein